MDWYPYDTLSTVEHLDKLLTGANRERIGALLAGEPKKILDLACQDGDWAFFRLRSLGHQVDAVDHPVYNHNTMRGLWAMKSALGSAVRIAEADLNRPFTLPSEHYDLAMFFGALYHLRNPFLVMDELATRATHCLVSTVTSACFPGGAPMPTDAAAAYLLRERELNDDETNYFIFSENAFRVLLERTHWRVCDYLGVAVPSGAQLACGEERAFCLVESLYGSVGPVELGKGWHYPEDAGWRWTEREFSVTVAAPGGQRTLTAELFLPPELMRVAAPLIVSMAIVGREAPPARYESAGIHKLVRTFAAGGGGTLQLDFRLSGAIPPDDADRRERGVIVNSIVVE